MTKTNARAVANFFIQKSLEEAKPLDHLKLQKLIYFSYAWWCGNFGDYLFEEEIEAWPHGPVVRDIYVEFCDSGKNFINRLAQVINYETYEITMPKVENEDVKKNLLAVWNVYKNFSGIQLSNLTHSNEEPWYKIKNREDLSLKPRIDPQLIKSIYQKKVEAVSK